MAPTPGVMAVMVSVYLPGVNFLVRESQSGGLAGLAGGGTAPGLLG